jgi:hypothetical protein
MIIKKFEKPYLYVKILFINKVHNVDFMTSETK